MKHLGLKCMRWCWGTFAVLTIATAITVTTLRLLLPHLDTYRDDVEAWVSEYLDQDVAIDGLTATWRGWTPVLQIQGIRLLGGDDGRTLTRFDESTLRIDLLETLRQQRLVVGRFSVSGLSLSLLRQADGAVIVEGVAPDDMSLPSKRQNVLAYLLQRQRDLTIDSARIVWRDHKMLFRPVVFSDVRLRIRNIDGQRQLEGSAKLPEEAGESFYFLLNYEGDLLTPRWQGRLFLLGEALKPSILLNYQEWMGLSVAEGALNFRLWSDWREAQLQTLSGQVGMRDVEVGVPSSRLTLDEAGFKLRVAKLGTRRWNVRVNELELTTPLGDWPTTALAFSLIGSDNSDNTSVVASASFLRIDDLAPVLPSVGALPEEMRLAFATADPSGDLHDLQVGYFPERREDERFLLNTRFANLGIKPALGMPGLTGIDGGVKKTLHGGRLDLDSRNIGIRLAGDTADRITLDQVVGQVDWQHTGDDWMLSSPGLHFDNPDTALDVSGEVTLNEEIGPQLDVVAKLERISLSTLKAYLPLDLLPERGARWFQRALVDGAITGGAALVRGPLSAWPFDNQEGTFKAQVRLADATVDFHSKWPNLTDVDAEIRLDGRQFSLTIEDGALLGTRLTDSTVVMQDVFNEGRVAQIRTSGMSTFDEALAVINSSPLAESLGQRISHLDITGEIGIDLDLAIPLSGESTRVSGQVTVADNAIYSEQTDLLFERMNGQFRFTENDFGTDGLAGEFRGMPITLALQGTTGETGEVSVRLNGTATPADVRREIAAYAPTVATTLDSLELFDRMRGKMPWQVTVAKANSEPATDGPPRRLDIQSSLRGLALDLPPPLGKRRDETTPLTVAWRNADGMRNVAVEYGDHLALTSQSSDSRPETDFLALRIGDTAELPAEPGKTQVRVELDEADSQAWAPLVRRAATLPSSDPPRDFSCQFNIASLSGIGDGIDDVAVSVERGRDGLTVDITAEGIVGNLQRGSPTETLVGQFSTLHLPKPANDSASLDVSPAKVPALDITADSLMVGDRGLGSFHLQTEPTENGLTIKQLSLAHPAFSMAANGAWSQDDDGSQHSSLTAEVNAAAISGMLENFGYDAANIEGGETALKATAHWPGTPMAPDIDALTGTLDITIRDGRLLDVQPQAAKLFGLLSVQMLPRRLFLDFADIFRKGFLFHDIAGTFRLADGNAYTEGLAMNGPSAEVTVTGRTGLAEQDYDQVVTVRPTISESIPWAGAFFGPAGAGVGAALFLGQKMFSEIPDRLDSLLQRTYSVRGSWTDPSIERIRRAATLDG